MKIKATSFADPADLRAYNRARLAGKTHEQALEVGDNGQGAFLDLSTVAGTGPACALHGRGNLGKHVRVVYEGKQVVCHVRDLSPDGVCDLNPDACSELGLTPPVLTTVDLFFDEEE